MTDDLVLLLCAVVLFAVGLLVVGGLLSIAGVQTHNRFWRVFLR